MLPVDRLGGRANGLARALTRHFDARPSCRNPRAQSSLVASRIHRDTYGPGLVVARSSLPAARATTASLARCTASGLSGVLLARL